VAGIFGVVGLSAVVWVHHMYMTGWAPQSNYPFMMSTEMISIPFSFLVLVMLGTMWRGMPWKRLPMMAVYAVVWNKVIGGITGVYLSDTPVDQYMHGSMFVVAHFHYVLSMGVVFGIFSGFYYWFSKMTGLKYPEVLGQIHFWIFFIGVNLTFFPMHFLGLAGMPRRVPDYPDAFAGWNAVASFGSYISAFSVLLFFYIIYITLTDGEKNTSANQWKH
jgi:cytochrome c oxidase subunit 1